MWFFLLRRSNSPRWKLKPSKPALNFISMENFLCQEFFYPHLVCFGRAFYCSATEKFLDCLSNVGTSQTPLTRIFIIWVTSSSVPETYKNKHISQITDNMINGFWCLCEIRKNCSNKVFFLSAVFDDGIHYSFLNR